MKSLRVSNYCLFQNILYIKNKMNCIYSTKNSYQEYYDEKERIGFFFYTKKFRRYMLPIIGILYIIILNLLNTKGIFSNDVQHSYTFVRNLSQKEKENDEFYECYNKKGLESLTEMYRAGIQKSLRMELNTGKNDVFNKYSHIFIYLLNRDVWKQYELSPYILTQTDIYVNKFDPEINKNIILFNKEMANLSKIHHIYTLVLNNERLKFNSLNEYFSDLYSDLEKSYKSPLHYAKKTLEELKEFVSIGNNYVEHTCNNALKKWLKKNDHLDITEFNILLMTCRLLWRKTLRKVKEDGIPYLNKPFEVLDDERLKIKAKGGNPLFFKANEFYEKNRDIVTYKNAHFLNSLKRVNVEFDEDFCDEEEEERKQRERDRELLKNNHKTIQEVSGANDDSEDTEDFDDYEDYDDYDDYEDYDGYENYEVNVYPRQRGIYNYYYEYEKPFLLTPEILEQIEKFVEKKVERKVEKRAIEAFEDRMRKQFVNQIKDRRLKKTRLKL